MTNSKKHDIIVNGKQVEYVDEFTYLGQTLSIKNRIDKELNVRIAKGWKKYWSLKNIMKRKLSKETKRQIFNKCIIPTITYGSETWSLRKIDKVRLARTQRKMERSLLNIKLVEKVSNEELRRKTNFMDVVEVCKKKKWKWAGHVQRMKNDRWTKRATERYPRNYKRRKGRQKQRWSDDIRSVAGSLWGRVAQDREKWAELLQEYASH